MTTLMMNGSSAQHHRRNISGGGNSNRLLRQVFIIGFVLICYASLQLFYSTTTNGHDGQRPTIADDHHNPTSTDAAFDTTAASAQRFSLAYEQSYGFFTDIPNEEWKMRQATARKHRHHDGNPLLYWEPNTPASMFYYYNYEPLFACPQVQRVGGPGDGPKWTCDPHRIPRAAKAERAKQLLQLQQTQENATAAPCLIYSIGCKGIYLWEDSLYEMFGPNVCEFHIFDPGHYDRPAKNAERNMHYHQWGITSSYHPHSESLIDNHGLPIMNVTFKTFDEAVRLLNHTNRTIEILKADCEYCEWFSYKDWIRHGNVRQLLVETHYLPMPKPVRGVWPWAGTNMTPNEFFDDLQEANYMMFSKEPNTHKANKGNLVEWSFIRLHPDFLHGP